MAQGRPPSRRRGEATDGKEGRGLPSLRAVVKLLIALLLLLALLYLALRWLERRVAFMPTRAWDLSLPTAEGGAEEIHFRGQDGVLLSGAWFPRGDAMGVILYCHGNAGNLSHRIPIAMAWRRLGYSILLFDYRGYGRSEGTPSEEGLIIDARAAWREAVRLGGENAVIAGRSIGTVPAIELAGEVPARGLVLDSPPLSAREMAGRILPIPGIGSLLSLRLDNLSSIDRVRCPLLIIHGVEDEVIPFDHGRRLFDAAPEPKTFLPLPGLSHNSPREQPQVLRALADFLDRLP